MATVEFTLLLSSNCRYKGIITGLLNEILTFPKLPIIVVILIDTYYSAYLIVAS